MSTWTSRAFGVSAASLVLAACVAAVPGGATRAIAVSDGAFTVAGPQGYCIDRTATRDGPEGAFALLGTCAAISGSRAAAQPSQAPLLTVSVLRGAPQETAFADSFPALAAFFRSDTGRAALSRSGKAGDVSVEDVATAGDVLYLRVRDTSAPQGQPVEPEYWRAVLAVGGRIVTVSALGLRDRPVPSEEKRRTLVALIDRLRAANPAPAET